MGMGLAIVRTIVDAHAGSIDVEIGEQGRTVFKVSLPAVAVARRRAGRAPLDVLSSA
jgi:nitrogen-specific signal transduction histidine kinase